MVSEVFKTVKEKSLKPEKSRVLMTTPRDHDTTISRMPIVVVVFVQQGGEDTKQPTEETNK